MKDFFISFGLMMILFIIIIFCELCEDKKDE